MAQTIDFVAEDEAKSPQIDFQPEEEPAVKTAPPAFVPAMAVGPMGFIPPPSMIAPSAFKGGLGGTDAEIVQRASEMSPIPQIPSVKEAPPSEGERFATRPAMGVIGGLAPPPSTFTSPAPATDTEVQAGREAANLLLSVPRFATSLKGVAAAYSGAAYPLATTAAFTADTLKTLGKQILDTYKNWQSMSGPDRITALEDIAGQGALGALLGTGTIRGIKEKLKPTTERTPDATKEVVEQKGGEREYPRAKEVGIPPEAGGGYRAGEPAAGTAQPTPEVPLKPTATETTPPVPAEEIPTTPTATGLRPAIRLVGGKVVAGDAGVTHPDIIKANGLKAEDIDQRGFVREDGSFVDREQAAATSGVPTEREPGRQHSTDLPEAKPELAVEKKQGEATARGGDVLSPEQSAAPQAVTPQTIAPPVRVTRGLRARKVFDSETTMNGPDILSWITENMPLMSKSSARAIKGKEWWSRNQSLYDDAAPLQRPHHNIIYGGKSMPDQVAQAAYDAGVLKSPDVPELWQAIRRASNIRAKAFETARKQEAALQNEIKAHQDWLAATKEGEERVHADNLKIGDVMEVEGQRVEVTGINADTGEVTLKDGTKFGIQKLQSGQSILVENFAEKPPSEELFGPEEMPFNLAGEKANIPEVKPPSEKAGYGTETLAQDEMFAIQQITELKDPGKSADAAQQMYGGPANAAKVVERQLAILDQNKEFKKAFDKNQRKRLSEVIALLRQRATAAKPSLEAQRRAVAAKVDANQKLTPAEKKIWDQIKGEAKTEEKPQVEVGLGPEQSMGGALYGFKGPAEIEQLTDSLKGVQGQKLPLGQRIKDAFAVGERLAGAKNALGKAVSGLKATGDYLKTKFEGVNNVDELLREKGVLSAELEARGWRVRQWEKQARASVPNPRDQAAIAKWVDAGGDRAELQRGLTETKPEFKQAYQDALNLKGDMLAAAENVRNYFEARLQEAVDAGVIKDGVEDYIHRMYEGKPALQKAALAHVQTGLLSTKPGLAKKRTFQFDWEAEKLGYKPVQSFIPRIAEYESSLARAIAARAFIKKATTMKAPDGRPVIDIKGVGIPLEDQTTGAREGTLIKPQFNPARANEPGTPNYRGDYVNKEFPALSKWKWVSSDAGGKPIFVQGDVAIHPDFVHRINALLEPSRVRYGRYGAVLRPALGVSSAFKQTMLDLSGFHQVQIAVHGLEHKVNPFNLVQSIDFENPNVDGLLKGGMTLGGDYRYSKEGLVGTSLTRRIPGLGPVMESYHQWLFQDFIPRVKTTMALKALERNRARYPNLSEEQLFNKTAMQANSAFGELNYIMLERSKTAQDMARIIFLAPDFLEARGRFAAEALSKGGKRFGNEQRTALFLGALTMYVTARLANKALDDQYHFEPENLFSIVHNGRAYGLRTVQGDILHMLEKPLQFWMHRLNPVFGRTALEMGTKRDEFGRKRSFPEVMWDTASNIMPISLRSGRERSIWESLANSFGITERRWQDTDSAYKLAKAWKDKHGIGERGEFIYDPEKDPLRGLKIALSRNDDAGAASEIRKLVQSKTYTVKKLDDYFNRYAKSPFTGSYTHDEQWMRDLTEDQKKTVLAAKQHKKDIGRLYHKALGQYFSASRNPL